MILANKKVYNLESAFIVLIAGLIVLSLTQELIVWLPVVISLVGITIIGLGFSTSKTIENSLLLLAFLMPLLPDLTVKVFGYVNFDWWDGLFLAIAFIHLIKWCMGSDKITFGKHGVIIILYIVWAFIPSLYAINHTSYYTAALVGAIRLMNNYILLYFFVVRIYSKKQVYRFTAFIMIALAIVALVGIYQQISSGGKYVSMGADTANSAILDYGITGTFSNNLLTSTYLSTLAVIGLGLMAYSKGKNFILLLILQIISFFAIVFCYSRGGYLTYFSAIFFIFILERKKYLKNKKNFLKILVIFLVISLACVFVAKDYIIPKLLGSLPFLSSYVNVENQEFYRSTVRSTTGRMFLYQRAISEYLKHPLMGLGVGVLEKKYGDWANNTFLDSLTNTGPLGLILYLLVIISLGRQFYRFYRSLPDCYLKGIALGVFVSLVSTNIGNSFSYGINYVTIIFYFFFYSRAFEKWNMLPDKLEVV